MTADVQEEGFIYLYVSNEGADNINVYFDEMVVEYVATPVVQNEDYYPFGLTFNSYQRVSATANNWKFQGQEHDDITGWDQFKWRNHQPDIGRFFNADPLVEDYYYNSPYAFSENKVIAHVELEGLESKSIKQLQRAIFRDNAVEPIRRANKDINVPVKVTGSGQVAGVGGKIKVKNLVEFGGKASLGKVSLNSSGEAELKVLNVEGSAAIAGFGAKGKFVVGKETIDLGSGEIIDQQNYDTDYQIGKIDGSNIMNTENSLVTFSGKAGPIDLKVEVMDESFNFNVKSFIDNSIQAAKAIFSNLVSGITKNASNEDGSGRNQDEYIQDEFIN